VKLTEEQKKEILELYDILIKDLQASKDPAITKRLVALSDVILDPEGSKEFDQLLKDKRK
jgi:hypothetical protein